MAQARAAKRKREDEEEEIEEETPLVQRDKKARLDVQEDLPPDVSFAEAEKYFREKFAYEAAIVAPVPKSILSTVSSVVTSIPWVDNFLDWFEKFKNGDWLQLLQDINISSDFWNAVMNVTGIRRRVMKYMVSTGLKYIPWPIEYTCGAGEGVTYPSWRGYKDPSFYQRTLLPTDRTFTAVSESDLAKAIFLRKAERPEKTNKSCLLFPWFAQWFVEQFFKTGKTWMPDLVNKDKECGRNWSGNDIDLSTVYGDTPEREAVLRTHKGGKLRTQTINGEDYPLYWKDLNEQEKKACPMSTPQDRQLPQDKIDKSFVLGHPRQNLHPGVMLIATLFLREHNRLCDELAKTYGNTWDDERYFTSARMILIAILLKMVVEDYIQHINPQNIFQFLFDATIPQEIDNWQFSNRIEFEFNLLYRWHALIPDNVIDSEGKKTPLLDTFYDSDYLTKRGTAKVITAAVKQPANAFGPHSTPAGLVFLDEVSIRHARTQKLASYNDYCERFGVSRRKKFEDITDDAEVLSMLKKAYKTVDDVEYYVGIMSEKVKVGIFPQLLTTMVLAHAMKGIFGNPLCSPLNWKAETFDPKGVGMTIIQNTRLPGFISRNTKLSPNQIAFEVKQ